MAQLELIAYSRQLKGKSASRGLRQIGKIPAVMYGPHGHKLLEMDEDATRHVLDKLYGRHQIVPLIVRNSEGQEETSHQVLIREIQTHAYKRIIEHIDFLEPDVNTPITLRIPLTTTGASPAEKKGGNVQMIARDIPIICMPDNIPENIIVDVSKLDIGQNFRVKDIPLPANITLKTEQNYTVISGIAGRAAKVGEPQKK
ncbi:50S ribosomal protein L25 [Deltaproteobacteria bacterium TL4]